MFGFLGLTIGLLILGSAYHNYAENKQLSLAIRATTGKMMGLLSVSLPGLVLLMVFYRHVTFFPSEQHYSYKELLKWIHDARPFIVYNYNGEKLITRFYSYILIFLLSIALFFITAAGERRNKSFRLRNILVIPLILSLVLFFVIPDGAGAGMMSNRYALIFFVLLLTWVALRAVPRMITYVAVMLMLIFHFGLTLKHLNGSIRHLNDNAVTINKASEHIPDNSVILPVNLSNNWLELHFSNYLGAEKPMVILENYEANLGWFPVQWKDGITDMKQQINIVFVHGDANKLNEPQWSELKDLLSSDFSLIYTSPDQYVIIYQRIGSVE
jgi:hypothetical protein